MTIFNFLVSLKSLLHIFIADLFGWQRCRRTYIVRFFLPHCIKQETRHMLTLESFSYCTYCKENLLGWEGCTSKCIDSECCLSNVHICWCKSARNAWDTLTTFYQARNEACAAYISEQLGSYFRCWSLPACFGCLIYLCLSRPDIQFSVSQMSRFVHRPS